MFIHEDGYWIDVKPEDRKYKTDSAFANFIAQFFIANDISKNDKIYDFGCSDGFYLSVLENFGFVNLIGIEGQIPKQKRFPNILQKNLIHNFLLPKGHIISLEVGEHIPQKYTNIYVKNLANNTCENGFLILSWAIPGQVGVGHVNCLSNRDVIEIMTQQNFQFLPEPTKEARDIANKTWFKNSVMFFKKIK